MGDRDATKSGRERPWSRQRSRSRIDGNEPGDQEQGAVAHRRRRRNIAGGSWSINVLADGQGETSRVEAFSQRRSAGRRGGLAGWIHVAASTAAAGWWLPQGLWHKALTSSTQMWAPFAVQADVIAGARTDGALEENLQLQISERELRMS